MANVRAEDSGARATRPFRLGDRRGYFFLGVVTWLALFLSLSFRLALNRHFQVDEFQESYSVALLAEPELREFAVHPLPFTVALSYVARQLDTTTEMLLAFRFIFLVVLIGNLVLATFVQPFFQSPLQRLSCLFAISGIATFWRHGLEVRHDNLVLTGCLLLYGLTVRSLLGRRRRQPLREIAAGIVFIWLVISAQKGFVLAVPFLVLFLWTSWQRCRALGGALARVLLGAVALSLLVAAFVVASGTAEPIVQGTRSFFSHLEGVVSFSPWPRLFQIASAYPHVTFLAAIAVFSAFWRARRRPWRLTVSTVNAFYVIGMLIFLEINPAPFSYNFLYLVPFAFFAALDAARRFGRSLRGRNERALAGVALTVATLLGGLGLGDRDLYFRLVNHYQLSYIEAAEQLTDPHSDSVLDGVGMVLTRRPALKDWQLHGSFMKAYSEGHRQSFAEVIREDAPPVVFTSIRWVEFDEELRLLSERYVQVAKDFWLLGDTLARGNTELTAHRSGRYLFVKRAQGEVLIDGTRLQEPGILHLDEGIHRVESTSAEPILVHWIGPAESLRIKPLPAHLLLLAGAN